MSYTTPLGLDLLNPFSNFKQPLSSSKFMKGFDDKNHWQVTNFLYYCITHALTPAIQYETPRIELFLHQPRKLTDFGRKQKERDQCHNRSIPNFVVSPVSSSNRTSNVDSFLNPDQRMYAKCWILFLIQKKFDCRDHWKLAKLPLRVHKFRSNVRPQGQNHFCIDLENWQIRLGERTEIKKSMSPNWISDLRRKPNGGDYPTFCSNLTSNAKLVNFLLRSNQCWTLPLNQTSKSMRMSGKNSTIERLTKLPCYYISHGFTPAEYKLRCHLRPQRQSCFCINLETDRLREGTISLNCIQTIGGDYLGFCSNLTSNDQLANLRACLVDRNAAIKETSLDWIDCAG